MTQADGRGNFSEIIAAELPFLRRYARALTGSQNSGDTYAATTLEAILADPSIFDSELSPNVALFKAFHSIWSTSGRRIGEGGTDIDPLEEKAQSRLATLTPNTREAVLLNAMEGFRVEEIAQIMNVNPADAKTFLDIGLKEMADNMRGRVMIIEDEPIIAMDIQAIVEESGHEVVGISRTRDEAVAMFDKEAPQLVLADVQLADGSSGIDASNDILEKDASMPIVFITAYPERLLTGERPEPTFLITKPFNAEQVRAAVSQSLFFSSTQVLA